MSSHEEYHKTRPKPNKTVYIVVIFYFVTQVYLHHKIAYNLVEQNKFGVILCWAIGIARHNAGLSAKALSELAGLNKGYINRLENGRDFLPSLDALLNIIDACGISEEDFSIMT